MGRELRRVPKEWNHPKRENGYYIPLLGRKFSEDLKDWEEGNAQWEKGLRDDWNGGWKPKEDEYIKMSYEEWNGKKPEKEMYMPEWNENELTHIQLYENTTEGTPISPVFPAEEFEKLCEYAAENCTTFADYKSSKEGWMKILSGGLVTTQIGNNTFI